MAPHDPLQQLRELDSASPHFHEQLGGFLRGDAYRNALPNLPSESLASLIEYLHSVIAGSSDHASPTFQESLRELEKICSVKEVLPKSGTLPEPLLGCVHESTFDGSKVRVRRVRMCPRGNLQKVKETFHQVAIISKHLTHPNIVPHLGVTLPPLELISNWMPGGDFPAYIAGHPDADRVSLLSDVAEGLSYLHSHDVIHGDLKGSNILMDAKGNPRIADFGLTIVTQDLLSVWRESEEHCQSPRWTAPEILAIWWDSEEYRRNPRCPPRSLGKHGKYSKEADIFSFAGVTIEAFTGAVSFSEMSPRVAALAIMNGKRPPRPEHPGLTDDLWALIQQCWGQEAHLRPHALRVSCGLGVPAWKRLIDRPLTSNERITLITDIFDHDETEFVERLCKDNAQSFVDAVDQMLDSLELPLRMKSLRRLCKICAHHALLPRALQIPVYWDRSDGPLYSGGYADVRKGEHQGREVAVKVLRVCTSNDFDKIRRRFCKEVMTWKTLRHKNVLPLLGVTMGDKDFAMISEWMVNGSVTEFIQTNPEADRFELLKDIARGLIYMHSQGMLHGDLKGANVMVDQDRRARLADFGLLTFVEDLENPTISSSVRNGGTTRWMSPERLYPEDFDFGDGRPTEESDCYALGMVILEVLSGEAPFARDVRVAVILKVHRGERPERPKGGRFTNDLWKTLGQCWSTQPNDRPTVKAVLECLELVSKVWRPLPHIVKDVGTNGNKSDSISYYRLRSPSDSPGSDSQEGANTPFNLVLLTPAGTDDSPHRIRPRQPAVTQPGSTPAQSPIHRFAHKQQPPLGTGANAQPPPARRKPDQPTHRAVMRLDESGRDSTRWTWR